MKKLLIFAISFSNLLFAQEEFSFELYFEDALGNKDTLILGYDSNATNGIDPLFGELNMTGQPWDNTFEVRAGNGYLGEPDFPLNINNFDYQTKKQIKFKDCLVGQRYGIPLIIKTNNPPIQINWTSNPDVFGNDSCRYNSEIKNQPTYFSDAFHKNRYLRNLSFEIDGQIIMEQFDLDYTFSNIENLGETYYRIWAYLGNHADYNPETVSLSEETFSFPMFQIINNSFELKDDSFKEFELNFYDSMGRLILVSKSLNTDISSIKGIFIVRFVSNKLVDSKRFFH